MGRKATGSVEFRGTPPRWHARVTIPLRTPPGAKKKTKRVWVDLSRPDLRDNAADKATAQNLARATSKRVRKLALERGASLTAASEDLIEAGHDKPGLVVADLADKWFAHVERDPDTRPATLARIRISWAGSIAPQLASRAPGDLTTSVLRDWVWRMRGEDSAATVRTNASVLTRFFKDAIAEKWIAQTTNPMRDSHVRDALPTVETPELEDIVHFSRSQMEMLLASPLSHYDFGAYLFALLTGVRDGELLGAQFGDLREEGGIAYVHVLRQALYPRDGETVKIGPPKTKNSRRRIPLHPDLADWLAWWRETGWTDRVGRKPEAGDFIFPSPEGDAWRPRSADALRAHLKKADLPVGYPTTDGTVEPFVTHSFRHTFATLLGENDVLGEVIDRLLGHAPASTRGKHYQGVKLAPLARAVETLSLTLPVRPGVPPAEANRPDIAPTTRKPSGSEAAQRMN